MRTWGLLTSLGSALVPRGFVRVQSDFRKGSLEVEQLVFLGVELVKAFCVPRVAHRISVHRCEIVRAHPCHVDYNIWAFLLGLELSYHVGVGCAFEHHVTWP